MMKKKTLLMSALAVVLAAGMTIAPAMAYFSAHTEATGSVAIALGDKTHIDEQVKDWEKTVTISNEGPESVYVRAKAIAGGNLSLEYSGDSWSPGADEWYYYDGIVDKDGTTDPLKIFIGSVPEDAEEANVTVIYECTRVFYGEDGNPIALDAENADWTVKAKTE